MSLIDPHNEALWSDGTPRSLRNGFALGLGCDWSKEIHSATLRAASAKTVERKRAEGTDQSTIHGLSKKVPKVDTRHHPRVMLDHSVAGRMRAALASGPKTAVELAEATGILSKNVKSYLQNDVRKQRVVLLRDLFPFRYALPEQQP